MQPRAFQIQGNPQNIQTLKWVYILPSSISQTLRKETLGDLYETYHRLMFLTHRKVWFKTKKLKAETRIVLVPSPHLLSKCDKVFLKKKGYPIKANGCDRDSCRQCRDGIWL